MSNEHDLELKIEALQRNLLEWSRSNLRSFPWRESDSIFEVLVAEVLLQRTFAGKVQPVYKELLAQYPSPDELSKADVSELEQTLKPLGLQNIRASALAEIARRFNEDGDPESEDELLSLPHVGRYGANATLCFAEDRPRAIVDSNVVRVYQRVFGFDWSGDRDKAAWEFANLALPNEDHRTFNLALLDLGAEICTPDSPSCEKCPLSNLCTYFKNYRLSR